MRRAMHRHLNCENWSGKDMLRMSVHDYICYLTLVAEKISESGDYITELDSSTGDGDHWVNINMGFQSLMKHKDELAAVALSDMYKKIAMLLMSKVGGSSGVLYGSAYLGAAKVTAGKDELDDRLLCKVLEAWLNEIMVRGNAKLGYKTMIDSLAPAVSAYNKALDDGMSSKDALNAMKQAAINGAENTKGMEAIRGRACYQADKGIGHLDPGAVTMSMQLECLADYAIEHCILRDEQQIQKFKGLSHGTF